ncbi:MAG: glycosyltransferase family 2 protein [Nitrosotalea sp.]
MSFNSKITYIVVCFNSEKYITKCIDSILNQSHLNYDIIVIDNNSSDNTLSILQDLSIRNKKITVILNDENLGYANAITFAITKTNSEFLAILNADTYLHINWADVLLKKFHSDEQIMSLSGTILFPDGTIQSTGGIMDKYGAVIQRGSKICHDRKINDDTEFFYNDGSSFMVRSKIFQEVQFDPKLFLYYEDVDISWKIRMLSYKVEFVSEAISYHHLGHSFEDMSICKFYHIAKNRIYVCQKNYSLNNSLRRMPVIILLVFLDAVYYDAKKRLNGYTKNFFKAFFWNIVNIKSTLKEQRRLQRKKIISDKKLDNCILKNSIEMRFIRNHKR